MTPPREEDERSSDDDSAERPTREPVSPEKSAKFARQRARLLEDVAANATQDLKGKVGYTLSHYTDARDSDRILVERLLTTFYPEHIHAGAIALEDLRHVPGVPSMVRWRAKIQNDYGLFRPSDEVADFRRVLRRGTKDEMVATKPGPPVISVYSDESGKNQRYLVVGGVWIIDILRIWRIDAALREWKEAEGIKGEFKFSELNDRNVERAQAFVKKALEHSDVIGLKACILDTTKVMGRAKEEVVFRLYYELVMSGLEHEIRTGRVQLSRWLSIVKDADTGTDILAVPELERRVTVACADYFNEDVKVESITSITSHSSQLLQLADLFCGSIARVMNGAASGTHAKDHFAAFMENLAGFPLAGPGDEAGKDFVYINRLT